ncbi:MAG: 50S ribosomal protein L30 [bacterium]|nr:50S ribosomal protein L30 [bacterium]
MANKSEKVKIKLVRSLIGATKTQIKVVKALGLNKTNDVVEHAPSATVMGMVNKISHMVEIVD